MIDIARNVGRFDESVLFRGENANVLKGQLQTEGYSFASSTDSEVAAKLLGKMAEQVIAETGKPDLFEALRRVARQLTGAFTILAVDCRQSDVVVGARHDSPLVVGLGEGARLEITREVQDVAQDDRGSLRGNQAAQEGWR